MRKWTMFHVKHCAGMLGQAPGEKKSSAEYLCPMCEGGESERPGDCPKCGMALEPNRPAASGRTVYTYPMHPEVEQDAPGACPKCGMDLEPKTIAAEEDDSELHSMQRPSCQLGAGCHASRLREHACRE